MAGRRPSSATLEALESRGEAFAAELSADVPRLREKLHYGEGKRWAGSQGMTTWVLFLLAAEGSDRARPPARLVDEQPVALGAGRRVARERRCRASSRSERASRARRDAGSPAYGPATVDDLSWWTGWTLTQTRAALAVDRRRRGRPRRRDRRRRSRTTLEPEPAPEPWVALLPALDPTVMGWKERGWYLGEHGAALFDTSGNAGPTVWWNGRIVGGWAARKDGEIAFRLLEDVGADAVAGDRDRGRAGLGRGSASAA